MNKIISIDDNMFKHKTKLTEFALKTSIDDSVLILSIKQDKTELTTSLTKADILFLLEYLKLRGIK